MSWESDAWSAAKSLVMAAGAIINISTANIDKQATAIAKNYANVSAQQIRDRINEDIKTIRK